MYLRPKWILSHLFVLLLVVVMINLGFWQLRRLDARQERNATIEARSEEPAEAVVELVGPDATVEDGETLDFRRAAAAGRYATDGEVVVRTRSFEGRPGYWVLTPLILADERQVMVLRGWFPFVEGEDVDRPPAAATGPVQVTGVLRRSAEREGIQSADASAGVLTVLNRADIARIQQQSEATLLPVYLQVLGTGDPVVDRADLPWPVPLPDLGEGPHLSYAIQWFIFSTIAAGGYLLFLYRNARDPD